MKKRSGRGRGDFNREIRKEKTVRVHLACSPGLEIVDRISIWKDKVLLEM